jgi:hypothetical protein
MRRVAVPVAWVALMTTQAEGLAWELGVAPEDGTSAWASTYAMPSEMLIPRSMSSIAGFQPSMAMPADALAAPTACPHDGLVDETPWDDLGFLADGSDLILPAGTVLVDASSTLLGSEDSPYGKISVPADSHLVFADPSSGHEIVLHTLGIDVQGAMSAGSPTCRFNGNLRVVLHGTFGDAVSATSDAHMADAARNDATVKGIVADGAGAQLNLHGKLFHPTWTRLAAHVPGSEEGKTAAPSERNTVLYLQVLPFLFPYTFPFPSLLSPSPLLPSFLPSTSFSIHPLIYSSASSFIYPSARYIHPYIYPILVWH